MNFSSASIFARSSAGQSRCFASGEVNSREMPSLVLASAWMGMMAPVPVLALASRAACLSGSSRRPVMYTLTPLSASALAVTNPRPVPPPVTAISCCPVQSIAARLTDSDPASDVEELGDVQGARSDGLEQSLGGRAVLDRVGGHSSAVVMVDCS